MPLDGWRPNKPLEAQVSLRSELAGGCLNELSHELDLLLFVFGEKYINILSSFVSFVSDVNVDVGFSTHCLWDDRPLRVDVSFQGGKRERYVEVLLADGSVLMLDILKGCVTRYSKFGATGEIVFCEDQNWLHACHYSSVEFFIQNKEGHALLDDAISVHQLARKILLRSSSD